MNDHISQWQCPHCEGDAPVFKSRLDIESHLLSKHADRNLGIWGKLFSPAELLKLKHPNARSGNVDKMLSDVEIDVPWITTCPLCDAEGSYDPLDWMRHVLDHVHDFSFRSLPWPMDQPISLDKPVGTFDTVNERNSHIAEWAESVAPTLKEGPNGGHITYDFEGYEVEVEVSPVKGSIVKRNPHELSLQLCSFDLNPPAADENESTLMARAEEDYFSQNVYFVDGSSAGQFDSERSLSSRATEGSIHSAGEVSQIVSRIEDTGL